MVGLRGRLLVAPRLLLHQRSELEALCVAHGRAILDGLAVLLVVESGLRWVQAQEMPNFVAHVGSELLIAAVLQPNLHQTLPLTDAKTCTDHLGLFKLLA